MKPLQRVPALDPIRADKRRSRTIAGVLGAMEPGLSGVGRANSRPRPEARRNLFDDHPQAAGTNRMGV